jgi:hypothetical protein
MGGEEIEGWYDYRMIGEPVHALAEQGRQNGGHLSGLGPRGVDFVLFHVHLKDFG